MTRPVIVAVFLAASTLPGAAQTVPAPESAASRQVVQAVAVTGAHELSRRDCLSAAKVAVGEPLPEPPDEIAATIERRYKDADYSFARVSAGWDDASGTLTLTIDEGVISDVEFRGVDDRVARDLATDFALKAGDVFNRSRAREALRALLRPTRGAIVAARDAFDLVDGGKGRALVVTLREPQGRFRLSPDLGDREDWFTPVDGFVPSLGFGAAVFDHSSFNHAFVSGHLSFKTATDRAGYALGFEKPFLTGSRLFVGAEVHDLTASDDEWRVTSFEASLAASAVRRSFRDYYRRRGVQLNVGFRPQAHVELLLAWRTEREEPLAVASDFSLWRGDERFRPNLTAADGHLHALVVGASVDGRGFDRDSLESSYRHHQLDSAFGERLGELGEGQTQWRVDWQTEISAPDAFGSDFDFTRSILSARYRTQLSPHQEFGVRAIEGWSSGALPPQRLFALGGIGSVEGYAFKAESGTGMSLVNLEYALGWRRGIRVFGLFDAGRATIADGTATWMKGVGVGLGIGDGFRIDFGYRLDAIPSSLQVLFRFGRTF